MPYEFIAPTECMGDSLIKINNNASDFDQRIISLTNVVASLSTALIAADIALTQAVLSAAPVGAVQTFAMATAPTGWLECNGVVVPNGSGTVQGKTANFTTLHTAVGTTYGTTPGTLPDLRGEFVRGWDNSRGIDSGRTFGSSQANQIQSHRHGSWINEGTPSNGNMALQPGNDNAARYAANQFTQFAGGTETRPRNIALLYCIKY